MQPEIHACEGYFETFKRKNEQGRKDHGQSGTDHAGLLKDL